MMKNVTMTNMTEEVDHNDIEYSVMVRIILLAGLVVMSIIGNTLAAHKLMKKRVRKKRTTILFIHLSMADVLVTIFPMAGQLIWEAMDKEWYANSELCKLFKFLQTFSLVASNYMLVAIAIDRHQAITRPLATPWSPHWLVGTAWLLSLFPSLPNTLTFSAIWKEDLSSWRCDSNFDNWTQEWRKAYFSAIGLSIFVIPLLMFVCLYSHILVELRQASVRFKNGNMPETEEDDSKCLAVSPISTIRLTHQNKNLLSRARIKTTNLSLSVIVAFVVTNLPYIIDEFIRQDIFTGGKCDITKYSWCNIAKAVIGIAPVSNSAVNPFIYLLFNAKSPAAQQCTNSCCPITRTIYKSLNMIRVKFRQPTTSTDRSMSSGTHVEMKQVRNIRTKEISGKYDNRLDYSKLPEGLYHCTEGHVNVESPFLTGCDCRGEESHNHNCPHCEFCRCGQYGVSFSIDRRGKQSDFEISLS